MKLHEIALTANFQKYALIDKYYISIVCNDYEKSRADQVNITWTQLDQLYHAYRQFKTPSHSDQQPT